MKVMKKPVLWLFLVLIASTAWAGGKHGELPFTQNLYADGQLAKQKQLPIMMVFVSEHCGFCSALEADYIKPMLISGEYDDKVIIRVLNIDYSDITDFQGKTISSMMYANNVGAFLTPTIMFFDAEGNQVAEKILGYSTPSMFGGILDAAIDESLVRVREGKTLAQK
jgi:thioredoxin-related protein